MAERRVAEPPEASGRDLSFDINEFAERIRADAEKMENGGWTAQAACLRKWAFEIKEPLSDVRLSFSAQLFKEASERMK